MRFADLVEKHNNELAALETWNNGKIYEQAAKAEVPMFVRLFRYYAGRISNKWIMLLMLVLLFYDFTKFLLTPPFQQFLLQDGQIKFMG